jgi:heptosyltransferase II
VSDGPRILVVGPSWVGDMVMAQSLYRLLVERYGAARVDVVAPPWSVPVLARMPEVTRAIELDVAHGELGLNNRRALGRRLRSDGYERAIVLPRSFKAALVPFFARIRQRTGFRGEWRYALINDVRPFDPKRLNATVLRFAALAAPALDVALPEILPPRLAAERAGFERFAERLGVAVDRPAVALMPGAEYGPAKRWPVERFAALARGLADQGLAVWVLGSATERPLGDEITAAAPRSVSNLCGESTLPEVIDVLAAADAAVSNDSGLMHVAAAVDTHVVAIYGSSSPQFTPPLTERKTIFYRNLDCSPCFQRTCPLGHLNCLRTITVDAVLAATLAAVGGKIAPPPGRADG